MQPAMELVGEKLQTGRRDCRMSLHLSALGDPDITQKNTSHYYYLDLMDIILWCHGHFCVLKRSVLKL